MGHLNRLILFILLSFLLPSGVYAVDASSHSINVFNFQQKLANKGNARAQYKLATMYESGTGTEQDLEQAKQWYGKASSAGIKAADDRMTYLSIKQQGYDRKKHSDWLESIKKDAKESKGDAMFLLAQIYREGFGVKKDLNKALEILDQVSLLGAADVEDEMALIQQEVEKDNKAKRAARKKHKMEVARLAQQEKIQQQIKPLAEIAQQQEVLEKEAKAGADQKAAQQAESEKALQEEKIRRYKKAMMQLQLEQKQIDEQQAWAAGGDDEIVDDEI